MFIEVTIKSFTNITIKISEHKQLLNIVLDWQCRLRGSSYQVLLIWSVVQFSQESITIMILYTIHAAQLKWRSKHNHLLLDLDLYRPQQNCGKVMFLHLSVSHSVQGGFAQCMLGYTHPQTDTPSWADTLSWTDTPRADTSLGRHPLGRHPLLGDPPSRCLLQWTVRILLECILVCPNLYFQ